MEQNEEADYEKIGLTVLLAMASSVAVQWLLGKHRQCSKRNHQPTPEVKIKMIKAHEEESSDEFELISTEEAQNEEPQVEDEQKIREEQEKELRA